MINNEYLLILALWLFDFKNALCENLKYTERISLCFKHYIRNWDWQICLKRTWWVWILVHLRKVNTQVNLYIFKVTLEHPLSVDMYYIHVAQWSMCLFFKKVYKCTSKLVFFQTLYLLLLKQPLWCWYSKEMFHWNDYLQHPDKLDWVSNKDFRTRKMHFVSSSD